MTRSRDLRRSPSQQLECNDALCLRSSSTGATRLVRKCIERENTPGNRSNAGAGAFGSDAASAWRAEVAAAGVDTRHAPLASCLREQSIHIHKDVWLTLRKALLRSSTASGSFDRRVRTRVRRRPVPTSCSPPRLRHVKPVATFASGWCCRVSLLAATTSRGWRRARCAIDSRRRLAHCVGGFPPLDRS